MSEKDKDAVYQYVKERMRIEALEKENEELKKRLEPKETKEGEEEEGTEEENPFDF